MAVINLRHLLLSNAYIDTKNNIKYIKFSNDNDNKKDFYFNELSKAKELEDKRPQYTLRFYAIINQSLKDDKNYHSYLPSTVNTSKNILIKNCIRCAGNPQLMYYIAGPVIPHIDKIKSLLDYATLQRMSTNHYLARIEANYYHDYYEYIKDSIQVLNDFMDVYINMNIGIKDKQDIDYDGFNILKTMYIDAENNKENTNICFDTQLRSFAYQVTMQSQLPNKYLRSGDLEHDIPMTLPKPLAFIRNLQKINEAMRKHLGKVDNEEP